MSVSSFRTLDGYNFLGKRVLVRLDLNVPVDNGRVTDTTRIDRALITVRYLIAKGARVILLSHFGRPRPRSDQDGPDEINSLAFLAPVLTQALGQQVAFSPDCVGPLAEDSVAKLHNGEVLLLENTRFHTGEEANDRDFVAQLGRLGDVFVNDAFSAAHRAHASTEGIAHILPSLIGRGMQQELEALSRALDHPARPVGAIVGGAKISTKLDLLGNLMGKVDYLIIGGGMANTFLAAQGNHMGKSLYEHDLLDRAGAILEVADKMGCTIILPIDVVVAQEFKAHAPSCAIVAGALRPEDMALDIGPQTVAKISDLLRGLKTLVWNGPFGAFELEPFDAGTCAVAREAARLTREGRLVTVAGGGDTVAALNRAGVASDLTYISTAGGAFLEWLEGKPLPCIEVLKYSAESSISYELSN